MRANKSDLDLYYIGANSCNVIIPEDDLPKGVQMHPLKVHPLSCKTGRK